MFDTSDMISFPVWTLAAVRAALSAVALANGLSTDPAIGAALSIVAIALAVDAWTASKASKNPCVDP
ncbi:hypothetical protein ASG07_06970 [Sphingomonas sp. Leaf343]|nr:hypothetical protein ASG07_06970 [Sphingomonas sp. Leaf343]